MDEIRQRNDNMVQNAWYLAKESWKWDKRILLFLGITTLTGIALPVFGIYLPKVAVDLLLQRADAMRVLQVLGSMVGCMLILQGVHGDLSKRGVETLFSSRGCFWYLCNVNIPTPRTVISTNCTGAP